MNCPVCKTPLGEDVAVCPNCGEKVSDTQRVVVAPKTDSEEMEATTVIPVVGARKTAEPKSEKKEQIKNPKEIKEDKPKAEKTAKTVNASNALKIKIFTIVIACLATLAVGLGITVGVVLLSSVEKAPQKQTVENAQTKDDKTKKEDTIDVAELEVGESTGVAEKEGIKIDTDYPFQKGKKLAAPQLEYKTLRNSEFAYKCDVPADFEFVFDADGEIRYGASDKTAYMDIGAFKNTGELDAAAVKNMISKELGTSAEYEVSGDDWFIMRTVRDSVVYCNKCFASPDIVRYIEFVYPLEYDEIYDVYVNDIEDTFEKTN